MKKVRGGSTYFSHISLLEFLLASLFLYVQATLVWLSKDSSLTSTSNQQGAPFPINIPIYSCFSAYMGC